MTQEQASKPAAPGGASSFSFGLGWAAEIPKFSFGMKEPKKPAIAVVTSTTGSKPNFSFADAASAHAQEEPTAVVQIQKAAGFGASATGSKFSFGGASSAVASPAGDDNLFGGSNKPTFSFAQKKKKTPSSATTASPTSITFKPASSPAPGKSMFGGSAVSTASPAMEKKEEEAKETSATNKLSSLIQDLDEEAHTRYLQQCLLETNRALEMVKREEKRLRALICEKKKKLKRL